MRIPAHAFPNPPPRHLVTPNPAYAEWVDQVAFLLCIEAEHHLPVPCEECLHEARAYGNAAAKPDRVVAT